MKKWSIERKIAIGFAGAAAIPGALLILLRQGFADATGSATFWLSAGLLLAICVAVLLVLREIYLDIRAHHDVEQRLQTANVFLQSLLDNIPTMVFAKDAKDLRFVLQNRASEKLLGYDRAELIGKSDRDFFPPEQAEFFNNKDREVLAGNCMVDIPEEEIDTRTHGRRILHTRKVPVCDASGRPTLLLGISMDITEQKANERRILALLEDVKRHAAMLQSSNQELESFCYSVSHDLRAPLRAINGYAQLLQLEHTAGLNEQALRYLQTICDASARMARLIDDLLEFSRLGRQTLTAADVDMNEVVAKALDDVLGHCGAQRPVIEIHTLLPARGDRHMLHSVWLNLIDNAVKYSSGSRPPTVSIRSTRKEKEVVYAVQDNGIGFDMQYYEKLFGVFQRLHGVDEFPGNGVGLAIVQRILQRHGGRAWAESEPGKGATFYFSLPATASKPRLEEHLAVSC